MLLPLSLAWALAPLLSYAAPSKRDVPSAASFYVPSLPGLEVDPSRPLHMYAGHLESDPSRKNAPQTEITPHLYFFMIKARRLADKERVVFWFNGGPGCSSFDGLMLEVGPFRTDGKGGLKWVEGSWDEYTTMVFVDQPVGTGFSYTGKDTYVHELDEAASQVVEFMRNFYAVFPEFKNMETFVAGESFAGQYVPYIAEAILSSNLPTPLRGLAIGNGWIDGESQYPGYLEYALKHKLIEEGTDHYKDVQQANEKCMQMLRDNQGPQPPSIPYCENLSSMILKEFTKEIGDRKVCLNVYDIRLSDDYPACGANWPPELSDITPYLRRDDVIKAIHATAKSEAWKECTGRVGSELKNQKSASSITLFPQLLEKLEILLFSGDQDWICNYVGTEKLIANLNWNGAQGLGEAEMLPWVVNGVDSGTWVTARNLTYVRVYNSSHMVPYDLPQAAHDMMLRFMGVDITQLASGSAKVPSKVGNDTKPALQPTTLNAGDVQPTATKSSEKSPEQDKAMWEAYYNAGSAALSLLVIALVVGLFLLCRRRRRERLGRVAVPKEDLEESIPLQDSRTTGYRDADGELRNGTSLPLEGKMVFEVGDSDGEDEPRTAYRAS